MSIDVSNVPVISKVEDIGGIVVGITADGNLLPLARISVQQPAASSGARGNGSTLPKKRGRKPMVRVVENTYPAAVGSTGA